LASTEIIHSDGKITPGPDLPEARSSHCQLSYEQSTFIIGGSLRSGRTVTVLKFNSSSLNSNPMILESMLRARSSHACTIFKSALHDERPIIIVAGGFGSGKNIAEVLDFTQEGTSWKEIGKLPVYMSGPQMTPTSKGDNVILTFGKSIYTLSLSGSKYQWIKLPHELSIDRYRHVQLLVPASTIEC